MMLYVVRKTSQVRLSAPIFGVSSHVKGSLPENTRICLWPSYAFLAY